jgi:hypothetical protein
MKPRTIVVFLSLLCLSRAWADEFSFQPDRIASIKLTTSREGAQFVVKLYDRVEDKTSMAFKAHLTKKGEGVYITPKGTTFTLKHLPAAVNAEDRFNRGDWQLSVTGGGPEFESLKTYAPDYGGGSDTEIIFLGSKTK